jgi:hypothetical protein
MKTLTPKQIVALGPCRGYDLKQVTELFNNKESVTYLEILDTDKIPLGDIIWVFCQLTVLKYEIREQWLEVIVTRAVTNHALHYGVDNVEQWAKNWLNGNDRTAKAASSIYSAAYAAASDAIRAAACIAGDTTYAAYDAAYVATCYAARGATAYATARAAYATTAAAADDACTNYAARAEERKQQIQDLKKIL